MDFSRLFEASSFAGYGLIAIGIKQVIAGDYSGIGSVGAGLAAVFKREAGAWK